MRPFVLEVGVVAAAEITTLKTDVIGPGQMFQAYSIMARDETNAIATYIEIGIFSGTRLIPIDSTPGAFAAKTSHTIYWPAVVGPGQGIYAVFATPTADDKLSLVAAGMVGPVGRDDNEAGFGRRHGERGL